MLTSIMITLTAVIYATALSVSTISSQGFSVILCCAGLAFVIQWLSFIPAYIKQSERFYDLVGSITYIIITSIALYNSGAKQTRAVVLACLVLIWAFRLGDFLYKRVHQDGGDRRFDEIKPKFGAFLIAWTLQGLWVLVTASAAWVGILSVTPVNMNIYDMFGILLWLTGFAIEVMADHQKRQFRSKKGSSEFIQSGLWRYSRHPNYFGEILLWVGIMILAFPAMEGWAYVSMLSPVFVAWLLTQISGVPMLEAKSNEKWGDDPRYQDYLARTSCIILRKPKSSNHKG